MSRSVLLCIALWLAAPAVLTRGPALVRDLGTVRVPDDTAAAWACLGLAAAFGVAATWSRR